MSDIIGEACAIAKELKDAVIIGAVAVMLHTKRSRTSNDVDIVLVTDISHDDLIELGYIPVKRKRDSWYSPRGIKVDIYRENVSGIPISDIEKDKIVFNADTNKEIKCASLEFLILAKYRSFNASYRPNDREDLKAMLRNASKKLTGIGWRRSVKMGWSIKR